jgi:hypothetical protein
VFDVYNFSVMSKTLPKMSRKSRPTPRTAARSRKVPKELVFTAEDMRRQRESILRILAVPTVAVSDPTVSETGVYQPRNHNLEV